MKNTFAFDEHFVAIILKTGITCDQLTMETTDSGDGLPSEQERAPRRRCKKNKVSKLYQRLSPNFALRDTLMSKKDDPKPENKITCNKKEMDPKKFDFQSIVTCLPATFILEYLQKVLKFLRSTRSELSFPCIAPFKEEFLIRIAQDNKHLSCPLFSPESQSTVKEMFNIIHQSRYQFRWVYVFGGGRYSMK